LSIQFIDSCFPNLDWSLLLLCRFHTGDRRANSFAVVSWASYAPSMVPAGCIMTLARALDIKPNSWKTSAFLE